MSLIGQKPPFVKLCYFGNIFDVWKTQKTIFKMVEALFPADLQIFYRLRQNFYAVFCAKIH